MTQRDLYEKFKDLHERAGGFIMPNPWDGVSALLCKEAGFEALGTSSAAIAFSLGRQDGLHEVSREEHLQNAELIGKITGLPVNGDLEDGFGPTSSDVVATIEAAIGLGLAGVGIEDTTGDPHEPIRAFDDAVDRVRAAARAANGRICLPDARTTFCMESTISTIRSDDLSPLRKSEPTCCTHPIKKNGRYPGDRQSCHAKAR